MNLPNCKRPCGNCPFRKDSLKGWLGKTRMTEILESDSFTCHKTSNLPDKDKRQCAGHMLIKGNDNIFVRTAKAMAIDTGLEGIETIFESEVELIKHHTNGSKV